MVDIGKCKLDLPWNAYYEKELDVRFSRSYGPGRYDPNYEERGIDYPIGYVRWTERRNMECVLDLVAAGRLDFDAITSAVVPFDDADAVYEKINRGELRGLGVVFRYPLQGSAVAAMPWRNRRQARPAAASASPIARVRLGVIGCGNYATTMLLPHLKKRRDVELVEVATATALSAANAQAKFGFRRVSTDYQSLLADPEIDAVLIATRHDSHAVHGLRGAAGRQGGVRREAARGDGGPARGCAGYGRGDRQRPAHGRLQPPLRANPRRPARSLGRLWRAADRELYRQRRPSPGRQLVRSIRAPRHPLRRRGRPFHRYRILVARRRSAERAGGRDPGDPDNLIALLTYPDGSIAKIAYVTTGDPRYPKEVLEVFGDGKVARMDNFKRTEVWRGGRRRTTRRAGVDKGQKPSSRRSSRRSRRLRTCR